MKTIGRIFLICATVSVILFNLCACKKAPQPYSGSPSPQGPAASASPSPSLSPSISPAPSYEYTAPTQGKYSESSNILVAGWDEYETKPAHIQEGTMLNYRLRSVYFRWDSVGTSFGNNVFEGLLYMYMNDPEDIRGLLAESWTCSDDFLTWTFKIRNGVSFSDGTICDAEAISKTLEYQSINYINYFSGVESWHATANNELVFTMSSPAPLFEHTAVKMRFASPTAFELHGSDSYKSCIGTGPYYIDLENYNGSNPGTVILKANRGYYLPERYPCIETIKLSESGVGGEFFNALLAGDCDGAVLKDMSVETADFYLSDFLTEYSGNVIKALENDGTVWLGAGCEQFVHREVREALSRFTDFNAINDTLFASEGQVMDSIWAKGTAVYMPTEDFYYSPEEGLELLASIGLGTKDISFDIKAIGTDLMIPQIVSQLSSHGLSVTYTPYDPSVSFPDINSPRVLFTGIMCSDTDLISVWDGNFLPLYAFPEGRSPLKFLNQDIYDPHLYEQMFSEYESVKSASSWAEILEHCRNLTRCTQEDFCSIGGIQPPAWLCLDSQFKNAIYFETSSNGYELQLYYLYKTLPS